MGPDSVIPRLANGHTHGMERLADPERGPGVDLVRWIPRWNGGRQEPSPDALRDPWVGDPVSGEGDMLAAWLPHSVADVEPSLVEHRTTAVSQTVEEPTQRGGCLIGRRT